jgi:hypothetical protein
MGYGFMSAEETLGSLFRGGAGLSFSLAFKDFATKYLLLHYYWAQPLPIATSLICFLSSNSEHHAPYDTGSITSPCFSVKITPSTAVLVAIKS